MCKGINTLQLAFVVSFMLVFFTLIKYTVHCFSFSQTVYYPEAKIMYMCRCKNTHEEEEKSQMKIKSHGSANAVIKFNSSQDY